MRFYASRDENASRDAIPRFQNSCDALVVRCHAGEVVFCVGYNCKTDLSAKAARGTLKEVLLRFAGRGRPETKKETKARLVAVGGAWLRGYVMAVVQACIDMP
jgi:hypothetical protein